MQCFLLYVLFFLAVSCFFLPHAKIMQFMLLCMSLSLLYACAGYDMAAMQARSCSLIAYLVLTMLAGYDMAAMQARSCSLIAYLVLTMLAGYDMAAMQARSCSLIAYVLRMAIDNVGGLCH